MIVDARANEAAHLVVWFLHPIGLDAEIYDFDALPNTQNALDQWSKGLGIFIPRADETTMTNMAHLDHAREIVRKIDAPGMATKFHDPRCTMKTGDWKFLARTLELLWIMHTPHDAASKQPACMNGYSVIRFRRRKIRH